MWSGAGSRPGGNREPEPAKIIADGVFALDDPRLLTWRRNQTVHLDIRANQAKLMDALVETLGRHSGEVGVVLHVAAADRIDEITLGEDHSVDPGPPLERAVTTLLGDGSYRVEVRRDRGAPREPRRGPAGGAAPTRRG